nr:hypothetical protein [Candidatus Baldrarchaeota archaeon]
MLGEEVNTTGRDIVERLKKGLPVEDEVIVGDLIAEYGEQVLAEAIELLKWELHDSILIEFQL